MTGFGPARAAMAALLFGVLVSTAWGLDDLQVKTDKGKLEGKMTAESKVRVFLGIPYAAPPVGTLRWKAPQAPERWHGVRKADAFGSRCMQPTLFADMVFRDPGMSEDCLTLNVWTPAPAKEAKKAKLPVMVWIYGGGFVVGSTSEARQDGGNLAKKGVVVVSMNYRLGVFGFFAHPSLIGENSQHAAGNYGLLDQAAAIAWVKHNIALFGGDPENITLFGESAGSFSVSAQLASPLSKDLIQHAIGESGAAIGLSALPFPTLETAEREDKTAAAALFGSDDLAALRAMPAQQLMERAAKGGVDGQHFQPDVDGYFLPESVSAIYAEGKQAHIPLLAGWNRDEGTAGVVNAAAKPSLESLRMLAQKDFGSAADRFLQAYKASTDDEALRVTEDYAGDRFIAYSTWAWLEDQVATGQSHVFRYRFDRPSPGDPNHAVSAGAFHSDDIEYVFGNLDSRKGAVWTAEDYALSDLIQTYWTDFARNGNPNGARAPVWPEYSAAGGWQVMHLDAPSASEQDAHRDRYLFLRDWSKSSSQAAGAASR